MDKIPEIDVWLRQRAGVKRYWPFCSMLPFHGVARLFGALPQQRKLLWPGWT